MCQNHSVAGTKRPWPLFHVFGVLYPSERGRAGRGGGGIKERLEEEGKWGNTDIFKGLKEEDLWKEADEDEWREFGGFSQLMCLVQYLSLIVTTHLPDYLVFGQNCDKLHIQPPVFIPSLLKSWVETVKISAKRSHFYTRAMWSTDKVHRRLMETDFFEKTIWFWFFYG